eukprot:gene7917-9297_t
MSSNDTVDFELANKKKRTKEEEFYDTNSDFSVLTVSNREDLEVCLGVLKKEILQFKNMSESLIHRLVTLEKGVGNERINQFSSSMSSSSHFHTTGEFSDSDTINNEQILANCMADVHRLLEKQKLYETILSQREAYWEQETDSLRHKMFGQISPHSPNSSPVSSYSAGTKWRKIAVVTVIVIVWPIISHFIWKAFTRWLQNRRNRARLAIAPPTTNAHVQAATRAISSPPSTSSRNKKRGAKKQNISAPDIVKALIQGRHINTPQHTQ